MAPRLPGWVLSTLLGVAVMAGLGVWWTHRVDVVAVWGLPEDRFVSRLVCVREGLFIATAQLRAQDRTSGLEVERWTIESSLDTWYDCTSLLQEVVAVEHRTDQLLLRFRSGVALTLPRHPWERRYGISKCLTTGWTISCEGAGPELELPRPPPTPPSRSNGQPPTPP